MRIELNGLEKLELRKKKKKTKDEKILIKKRKLESVNCIDNS